MANFIEKYFSLSTISRMAVGAAARRYLVTSLWPCRAAQLSAVCPWASIDSSEKPDACKSLSCLSFSNDYVIIISRSAFN